MRSLNRFSVQLISVLGLSAFISACGTVGGAGGGGGGSVSSITSVTVSCSPSTIQINQTSKCSATVTGTGNFDSSVTWSADNGAIDSSGNYTAPASPTMATVKATSKQDSTKSGTATNSVQAAPTITSVTVSCTSAQVQVNQTSQCSANVQGTGNFSSAVTWSVQGGGSINSAGLYTAPATVPNPPQVAIKATSVQDPTKSAAATVTVNSTPPTITSVTVTLSLAKMSSGNKTREFGT